MELFADQRQQESPLSDGPVDEVIPSVPWTVLLVDDDAQMHQVTRLALSGFTFEGRKLNLISAHSAQEAKVMFQQNSDIALALVDVVMETEHAGLELVKFIREELGNNLVRVVLRTGQAGQAPEDIVIREYEIDDYKEKTELTTQKLKTLLYSMLRSYRDLCLINQQKSGLKKVIESSAKVQNTTTLQAYAASVLEQLTSLLQLEKSAFYCLVKPRPNGEVTRALTLAATGEYVDCYSECAFNKLPEEVANRCQQALEQRHSQHFGDAFILYTSDEQGVDSLLYVNFHKDLSELDVQLLEIYMQNIGLTFENLSLLIDIKETSKELVYNLANAVEARSRETGAHVQRVSLICEKLALLYGLNEHEASMMKHASPLHDVGKVAVPDSILHKPGKLDADEWEIMKKHVDYGVEILSRSKRRLIVMAKEIAAYHHEKWDGSGYPNGLKGDEIPISGRIAALADVFDALGAKRSYKEPWSDEDIRAEIVKQKGAHFEPQLVDLLLNHWEEFIEIRNSLPD
jgi:response regulator RpfG family c-di-GMP phosphodiesterase